MLSQGGETYILGGKKIHYIFTYIEKTDRNYWDCNRHEKKEKGKKLRLCT